MKFLKTLLASTLGTLVAFGALLFFGFLFLLAFLATTDQKPSVRSGSVMTIDLKGPIPEQVSGDPLAQLFLNESSIDLHKLTAAIESAANDPRIEGLWIRTGGMAASWATLETVRRSIADFSASGKPVLASSPTYFMTESEYFVASVADSVFLEPEALFEFNGFALTVQFYGDLLEKLGVKPEVVRAGKYKGAVEPYTRSSMSRENREQMQSLLDGIERSFVSGVAESRNLDESEIRRLMNKDAMFSARDALKNGLVDVLAFEDEVRSAFIHLTGLDSTDDLRTVSAASYAAQMRTKSFSDKVAVVHITGMMVAGSAADSSPLSSGSFAGAQDIARAIRRARERKGVKAVVIRINSGGGFAPAGDAMLREVERTASEMPVIISMGDMAASGGYWVATGGDRIFAERNTITGSIGVFSIFFDASSLFEDKIGITFDNVATGPYADMFSGMRSYSDAERAMLTRSTEATYQAFLQKVATSRGLSLDNVHELAQGRVWNGEDALEIGLIDELGGLDLAIAYAANAAALESGAYQVVRYPRSRTFLEKLSLTSRATLRTLSIALGMGQTELIRQQTEKLERLIEFQGKTQALWPWTIKVN